VVLALGPALIGTVVWQIEGVHVKTTLKWTVPLGAACFVAVYLLESVLSIVVYLCAAAILGVMILTERIPRWWVDRTTRGR